MYYWDAALALAIRGERCGAVRGAMPRAVSCVAARTRYAYRTARARTRDCVTAADPGTTAHA